MEEVRCPACGFETGANFEVCPRCHRPFRTVLAPRSKNVGYGGTGVNWTIVFVGMLVACGLFVGLLLLTQKERAEYKAYVALSTVFDRRIEQIVADPKTDARTKDWAKQLKIDVDAGRLTRLEALDELKDVQTSENQDQRRERLSDETLARITHMIDDPEMPAEFGDIMDELREGIRDMSDAEFDAYLAEMDGLQNRFGE